MNSPNASLTGVTDSPLSQDILLRLAQTIQARLPQNGGDPKQSYVAHLVNKGTDAILKKIGEEATETVMAAKDGDKKHLVAEIADLWFHCMILLAQQGLNPDDVIAELMRREGVSGLTEKAQRT